MAPKTFLHDGWLCPESTKEYVKEILATKKDYRASIVFPWFLYLINKI